MAKTLRLRVLTPAEICLDATQVAGVQAQLVDGSIGIRPGHAPLLAELASGPLRYADETGDHILTLAGGILQVDQAGVTIYAGGLVSSDVISDQSAQGRFDRLTKMLLAVLDPEAIKRDAG